MSIGYMHIMYVDKSNTKSDRRSQIVLIWTEPQTCQRRILQLALHEKSLILLLHLWWGGLRSLTIFQTKSSMCGVSTYIQVPRLDNEPNASKC